MLKFILVYFSQNITVADLHSKILDARSPLPPSKFFQFHAVYGEIWQNRMLTVAIWVRMTLSAK